MECQSCGSPLSHPTATCAFCGSRSTSLPAAEVPVQHQRGEGRTLTKTYDDSLLSIQAGIDHSAQAHRAEKRRHRIGLLILFVVVAIPSLFLLYLGVSALPDSGDYEEYLSAGLAAIQKGDYLQGHKLLVLATIERPDSPEARFHSGSAFYAEVLEKPHLKPSEREKRLAGVHREMHFILGVQPNDPRANFLMGLYRYEIGKVPEAVTALNTSLEHIEEIPDKKVRERYSKAASAILGKLQANPAEKLLLYSQADDTLAEEQKEGIEVPFGR